MDYPIIETKEDLELWSYYWLRHDRESGWEVWQYGGGDVFDQGSYRMGLEDVDEIRGPIQPPEEESTND